MKTKLNPDVSECCCCGYKWNTGTSGEHECTTHLKKRIDALEKSWLLENRIIELLIVGGFVTRDKAEEARSLLS